MRIVIAEDSAVVRAGLVEILADSGHEVVAAVGNAEDLLAAVDEQHPDAAVVDVRMPPGYTDEGLRAAIAIRRDHAKTGVLVFSQYIETRYTADLLGAASGGGAAGVGYLLKEPGRRRRGVRRSAQPGGEPAAPPSTQKSSLNCSAPVATPTGSARSPPGSAMCSR